MTLSEEEVSDVSLGTFYVFGKENAGAAQGQFAQRGCGVSGLPPSLRRLRRMRRMRLLLVRGACRIC